MCRELEQGEENSILVLWDKFLHPIGKIRKGHRNIHRVDETLRMKA